MLIQIISAPKLITLCDEVIAHNLAKLLVVYRFTGFTPPRVGERSIASERVLGLRFPFVLASL